MRQYNIKINRFITTPVMFAGLPLRLAMYNFAVMAFCIMFGMILTSIANMYVALAVPVSLLIIGSTAIKRFYKRYGYNGFKKEQRNKTMPQYLRRTMSVRTIIERKKK